MNLPVSVRELLKEPGHERPDPGEKESCGVELDFGHIAFPFRAFTNFWAMADKQKQAAPKGQETIKNAVNYLRTRRQKMESRDIKVARLSPREGGTQKSTRCLACNSMLRHLLTLSCTGQDVKKSYTTWLKTIVDFLAATRYWTQKLKFMIHPKGEF